MTNGCKFMESATMLLMAQRPEDMDRDRARDLARLRREQLIRAGDWIRAQLDDAYMSQADLAKRLGTSAQTVSNWVNGKTGPDTVALTALSPSAAWRL